MYYEEKFIQNDSFKRIAEYNKSVVLPWDQVTHLDEKERRTMEGRNSFGLHHGLTISQHKSGRSFTFVFATETKEHLLAQYILHEKSEQLKSTIKDLVSVFDQHVLLSKQIVLPLM